MTKLSSIQVKKALSKLADPKKARLLQRYFKTEKGGYGEGDIFLGVTVPKQRGVAKLFRQIELTEILKLLKSSIHEHRFTALVLLVQRFSESQNQKQQERVVKVYLRNMKLVNSWDLVDLSASQILGAYLFKKDKHILYKLAVSSNLWKRRVSIVSTFYYICKKEPEDTLKISKILLKDREDLIHKATGWMLREVGKRCGQQVLTAFLDRYKKQMPRTMLRYAIERLPLGLRKEYMS